ncbi:MAG: hypothetical protein HY876_10350 [Coriobacteriales bacterium]|nr:hypothetical protein [Coriobacteriales bacterium]
MDAQLACPGCGAGVAMDGSSCPYCGTEYAAKNYGYCANCGGSQWAGPDGLSCPGCGQPLASLASAAYATAGTSPSIAAPLGGAAPIPVTAEAPAPAAQADRSKARTRTAIVLSSVGLFVVGFIGIMMASSVLRADSLVAVLALAATCLLIAAFAPRADGRPRSWARFIAPGLFAVAAVTAAVVIGAAAASDVATVRSLVGRHEYLSAAQLAAKLHNEYGLRVSEAEGLDLQLDALIAGGDAAAEDKDALEAAMLYERAGALKSQAAAIGGLAGDQLVERAEGAAMSAKLTSLLGQARDAGDLEAAKLSRKALEMAPDAPIAKQFEKLLDGRASATADEMTKDLKYYRTEAERNVKGESSYWFFYTVKFGHAKEYSAIAKELKRSKETREFAKAWTTMAAADRIGTSIMKDNVSWSYMKTKIDRCSALIKRAKKQIKE